MPDALDVLHERGGATEPDPEFRTELMWRVRTALAAPNVAVQVVEDESDRRPDRADDDYRR